MNKLLILLAVIAVGCASAGTVGTKASGGLLEPVIERTDAYIMVTPGFPEPMKAEYEAAKLTVRNTYSEDRTAAAASYLAVESICKYHDGFVNADAALGEPYKSTYLRSTGLLRRMYSEALKAAGTEAPTSRPVALVSPFPRVGATGLCTDGTCSVGKN